MAVAASNRYGVKGLTHNNPYMTLLKDYVEYFFPHDTAPIRWANEVASKKCNALWRHTLACCWV